MIFKLGDYKCINSNKKAEDFKAFTIKYICSSNICGVRAIYLMVIPCDPIETINIAKIK